MEHAEWRPVGLNMLIQHLHVAWPMLQHLYYEQHPELPHHLNCHPYDDDDGVDGVQFDDDALNDYDDDDAYDVDRRVPFY